MWSILVGLCHSIMFPTVFSLAIIKLGAATYFWYSLFRIIGDDDTEFSKPAF